MPRLTIHDATLHLDGQPWRMRGGELQYFRLERKGWERSLGRMRRLGFNTVTTYIPWIWHELQPGHYDFMGATDRRRDLAGFLRAAQAEGLVVVARPGPYINAEYQGFGYPRWLAQQIPQARMQGPNGQPIGGPFWDGFALGHPAYRAAVQGWYEAVALVLSEFWDRPIVAWQLDNETGLLQMNGLGRWDWNADTVARFRAWLEHTYGDLATLNATWDTRYTDFAAIGPPRPPFQQGLLTDWQCFGEGQVAAYLSWLAGVAQAVGVPVPLSHNESANFLSPINPALKAGTPGLTLYGYNLYLKMSGADVPADYPWASSYIPALFRALTPPDQPLLCWELGIGWFDPRARLDDTVPVQNLAGGLAQGLQGFSVYTVQDGVEPDGHVYAYQTVWSQTGQPGPRHAIMGRLLAGIGEVWKAERGMRNALPLAAQPSKLPTTNPAPLGFAFYYPNTRFTASEFLPGLTLQDPARVLAGLSGPMGIYGAIAAAGYGPQLRVLDLATAEPSDLAACPALIFVSKGRLDPATYAGLRAYVATGGRLITCGRRPHETLHGRPLDTRDLYPAPAVTSRYLHHRAYATHLVRAWFIKYRLRERSRLVADHPTSQHLLDAVTPLLTLLYARQDGIALRGPGRGTLRGDYIVETYAVKARILWHQQAPVAYETRYGAGTSTMIGSLIGGSYATPAYYNLRPAEREGIRNFWRRLLTAGGLPPAVMVNPGLEVGVQMRPTGDITQIVVTNHRAERQQGRLTLSQPVRTLTVLFNGVNSDIRLRDGMLLVDLAAGDAVIAAIT